ncbi:MAG: hypothetical protein Q7S95_01925 [bacterium]|nr:hypothetical protein [bacterium]
MDMDYPHDPYAKALAEVEKKYFGSFDTGLSCNCGPATITDHASHNNPSQAGEGRRGMVFGPISEPRELLDRVDVYHSYWCDTCGAMYMQSVIEGVRGYQPLEAREPIPRSSLVAQENLRAAMRETARASRRD